MKACEVLGLTERTLQRWRQESTDKRLNTNTSPSNKITPEEEEIMIKTATNPEYVNLSPHQLVARLADNGVYIASESSFYRVLKANKLNAHRGYAKPRILEKPLSFEATGPNQVYTWDITYLQSSIRGQFYYLYLFMDIFSRKIVGWEIHAAQDSRLSAEILDKICKAENIEKNQLVLHSDNGGPMKGATILATMQRLGVVPSFSRPSVSNDNPDSESLFRTVKYCPLFPSKPFESMDTATTWMDNFVNWYNKEHLHSGIGFVTPESKHQNEDVEILKKRKEVYELAKKKNLFTSQVTLENGNM
jgi:putative transposase